MTTGKRVHYSAETLEDLVGWVITGDAQGEKFDPSKEPRTQDYSSPTWYWTAWNHHKDGEIVRNLLDDETSRTEVTMYSFLAVIQLMKQGKLPKMQMAGVEKFLRFSYLGCFENVGLFCREAERQKTAAHPILADMYRRYEGYVSWMMFAESYAASHWFVSLNSKTVPLGGPVHVFNIPGGMR